MEAEAAVAAAAVVGSGGGVRVVARICAPADAATTNPAAANSFQVAATRGGSHPRSPDAAALLSFTAATPPSSSSSSSSSSQGRAPNPRKEEHRLDWCYLPHETNREVFLNEVRPLVHHLLGATSCSNTCVVSCGKDHLFMGSQDQPGLVTMAVEEILEFSKGAVRVSSYQVLQDTHIFDLLEPKDQEVLILEDAQGRTHLKGLSRVQVKSIEDFVQLNCFDSHQNKQPNKASTQLHPRGHQGLIIHISSFDQEGRECAVAKMNFLNLTGYVDPKQKNNGGAAAAVSNSNKSMYAMMNVVQALNSNQSFVPYRQSKVTRILQDSLCKTSGAVLIACLDEISCPDTVSALSLAARSSQVANEQYRRSMSATSAKRPNVNLSANAKSSSKSFLPSMHQPNPVVEKHDRPQWNNSAVKACQTPIAKKRSQPIMHSAKKTESSLSTPITMKQKDAKSSMSERSQPIMHSAKKTESSLSTPITMKQKDAKSSMSESSQSTMHSARKSESSFSTSIKMKQKDAKSTMGGRSQLIACSAKKTESSLSTSIKRKQKDAKPTTSENILLCPSINSSKEDALVVVPTAVKEVEEVQSSQDMEIHAPSKDEGFDKTRDTLDIVSSETQKVVSSSMEEEDYSSSGLHALSSCTDLGETCSSYVPDVLVEKSPVNANKRSPKLSDRLREISNSLKLLSARPLSITTQKVDMETPQKVGMEMPQRAGMEYVQPINIDVPEPKTPAMHLKFEHAENPSNSFKARSTGIKKSLLQECLTFLNSANKEQLKSLKGIGEKRANFIIELRENSPELFKEVDDLRDIIGMNKTEIKRMMSGIIDS